MNVVVGGGITGLWLARQLALKGESVTLVTRDKTGGLLTSAIMRYRNHSFRADLGGHVYTAQDSRVVDLLERVGAVRHSRQAFYNDVKWGDIPYPVQDHVEQLRMSIEQDRSKQWYEGMSLQDFALAKFGDVFYDRWFKPFNQRVWTLDPAQMDSDWVAGRVKTGAPDAKWGPNSDFLYAPGDMIIDQLFRDLDGLDVEVVIGNASFNRSSLTVNGNDQPYDKLFWTAPIQRLIGGKDLKVNHVTTLAVVLEDTLPSNFGWHWRYCDVGSPVHRVTNLSAYHPSVSPEGYSVLLLELPHELGKLPRFTQQNMALPSPASAQVGMVDPDVVDLWLKAANLEAHQYDVIGAQSFTFVGYPLPTLGLRRRMATAKEELALHNIYVAGRWGDHAYFNIEHCMTSADSAILAARFGAEDDYFLSTHYYGVYR